MQAPGNALVIETASEACSVALFVDGERVAHDHRILGRGHAERLVPMIAALPHKGRSERILVSLGPGSFTGVRIGIATARALGVAWGAQVIGYPTLALVAAQARAQSGENAITVCMNGGHGEWFVQHFDGAGAPGPVRSLSPEEAVAAEPKAVVAGNRAGELVAELGKERVVLDILPDAGCLASLPAQELSTDLSPIYGRAPDATPQKVREA
jgi:tRNA threonylcarbamoyl adenosine modification protein YeaZ